MAANESSTSLLDAIRKLNGTAEAALEVKLPEGGEHYYYNNFPAYNGPLKEGLATIQQALTTCEAIVRPRRAAPADFTDADDVADWTSNLLDDILERLDASLDAERARARGRESGAAAAGAGAAAGAVDDVALMAKLPSFGGTAVRTTRSKGPVRHAAGLARPQDLFQPPPDNRPDLPWRPRLEHLLPLASQRLDPRQFEPSPGAPEAFPHPFAPELEALPANYPPAQLAAAAAAAPPPPPPAAPESTPLMWVDSESALEALVRDLTAEGVTEVAVDLEQHGYRSFQGFTCLMQISTRTTDYVVDTLALRNQLGPALAAVFADPRVVKVLHGSDSDVEWLQRDFSLFLVNLFDTGQAARVLGLPSFGLAHLLEAYCGFQADKRYQLADWRLRPLSPDMLHYARCDTHFLLYVYDRLRGQLAGMAEDMVPPSLAVPLPPGGPRGALGLVLERSRQLCLKTYRKPAFDPAAYKDTLLRWGLSLTPAQASVFCSLLVWRDRVSRQEDESPGYVLPKAQLVALAQDMPESAKRVQSVLGRGVSEVLLRRIAEVVQLVADARHRPLQDTAAATTTSAATPQQQQTQPVEAAAAATTAAAAAAPQPPAAAKPPALKPRAVAPIRTAKAAVAPAPAPAPAAVSAPASAPEPAVQPPTASSQQQQQQGAAASAPAPGDAAAAAKEEDAAAAAPAAAAAVTGSNSLGGLKPRALKAPTLAVSRSGLLFGGSAAPTAPATAAADAAPAVSQSQTAAAMETTEDGKAGTAATEQGPAEPASAPVPVAATRPAVPSLLKRPAGAGGSSLMSAMFGGATRPAVPAVPAAPAAAATGAVAPPSSSSMAGQGSTAADEDEEERLAQQRVKRLRATFALPFVSAAAATPPAQPQQPGKTAAPAAVTSNVAEGPAADAAATAAGAHTTTKQRTTAADIRAAVRRCTRPATWTWWWGRMGREWRCRQMPSEAVGARMTTALVVQEQGGKRRRRLVLLIWMIAKKRVKRVRRRRRRMRRKVAKAMRRTRRPTEKGMLKRQQQGQPQLVQAEEEGAACRRGVWRGRSWGWMYWSLFRCRCHRCIPQTRRARSVSARRVYATVAAVGVTPQPCADS